MNSKINVIIVNGFPKSGKTTFEQMCSYILGPYYRSRSSVDIVKEIAQQCGWNGEKTLENRKFLHDLKQLLIQYNDLPFKDVCKFIDSFEAELWNYGIKPGRGFVFVDVREPEEIEKLKYKYNVTTVCIRRSEAELQEQSNSSDSNVLNYKYDYEIDNNKTYEDLSAAAQQFIKTIQEKI